MTKKSMDNLKWTGERVVPEKMAKGNTLEYQAHLDRILGEHLARYKWAEQFCENKTILDASCGSGYGTAILGKKARQIYGADISEEAIEYAREKYGSNKVKYEICDLEKKWLSSIDFYDIVVSFETIEHIQNPETFLKNIEKYYLERFIFSIPLNNEGEFHKQVYDLKQATNLIEGIFKTENIKYFTQDMDKIEQGIDENSRFILGVITENN